MHFRIGKCQTSMELHKSRKWKGVAGESRVVIKGLGPLRDITVARKTFASNQTNLESIRSLRHSRTSVAVALRRRDWRSHSIVLQLPVLRNVKQRLLSTLICDAKRCAMVRRRDFCFKVNPVMRSSPAVCEPAPERCICAA